MINLFKAIILRIVPLFEAIFNPLPKEQKVLNRINFSNPDDLKAKLGDRDVQLAMIDWVEKNLRPLENNQAYLKAARGTDEDKRNKINTETIEKILKVMTPYLLIGTPAHDLGHHFFDALGGAAIISNDPFIKKGYRNDVDAAFFGAMFHDCSTGVQHRYVDSEWELSHGEIASVIFYFNTGKLLSKNVRLLASYAIAAHLHAQKEITVKNGGVRKPWVDELISYRNKPVRLAVWITRWTDRLENGGDPATHLPRHALATLDGARVNGMDLHGVDWYDFKDQLRYLFTPMAIVTEIPVMKDGQPVMKDGVPVITKIPSMLQHLKGYAASADTLKISAYNKHDDKSKNMRELMDWKIKKSVELVDTVTNTQGTPDFNKFSDLMRMKSGNPITEICLETIKMVEDLWNLNTQEDQAHWAKGFELALESYADWLVTLTTKINEANDPTIKAFAPLVPDMLIKIL